MSIDAAALLADAAAALAAVIDAVRRSGGQEDAGILHRIGKLDTVLAAAQAAAARGQATEAASLASAVLRGIARDFPEQARPGISPSSEDRLRRSIAAGILHGEITS